MQETDTKLKADGWECHALLLELLRMFDGQLQLGASTAKLVNYQSERSVEGIRKLGDGKFGFDFARACANLLRTRHNEGRCLPTFSDCTEDWLPDL